MPDVTYSISYRVQKDFLNASVNAGSTNASMGAAGMKSQTFTVSTNAISISTAGLSSVGLAFLQNLSTHTASSCTVGLEAGGSFVEFTTLKAGEPAMMRLSAGANYFAIGTAGSRLRVDILEG